MLQRMSAHAIEAADDIGAAFRKIYVALLLGWQDIRQRYARSSIGAFWLTINMGLMIVMLSLIFGALFRTASGEFLPYVCAGLICWNFMSVSVNEGCHAFISARGIILQVRMPLFTHVMRIIWRNMLILAHNFVIFPLVLIVVLKWPGPTALLAVPGFAIVVANIAWMMLAIAVLCTRFRDMTQVMQNVMQIAFYATPIIWMPRFLPDHTVASLVVRLNPFYHLLSLIRSPLLSEYPAPENWAVGILLAVAGWSATLIFFGRYRRRIPYWL